MINARGGSMHFSNLNREIYAYIDPNCSLDEHKRAVLGELVSFTVTRQDADILVFDSVPEDYNVAEDVPLLCLADEEGTDACFVPENWTKEELCAYLDCAAAGKSTRDALQEKTAFIAAVASDDVLFCEMLCDILRDRQNLGCVGITTMAHVENARILVVYLDEALAGDMEAKAACQAQKLPVLVVLAKGMTRAQAKDFCPDAFDICDLYDVWQIQESLHRMLNLGDEDMGFYAGLLTLFGIGRHRDVAHGMRSIKRSAQMGDEKALLFLSLCRRYAVGCKKNTIKSGQRMAQAAQSLLDEKKERTAEDIQRLAILSKFISDDLLAQGNFQRARRIAAQAHRLCEEYVQQHEDAQSLDACAQAALQAACLAQDEGDTQAYVTLYLQYADFSFRAKQGQQGASFTREKCDEVLGSLDTIAQYLLADADQKDAALKCIEIGINWQQYVFDTWQDDAARAALAAYLEQRGQLYLQASDARAVEDFTTCIELCRDYAAAENAARFEANCYLNLGCAHFACEQYEASFETLQTAKALWEKRYEASGDADSASALCTSLQCLAKTAVAMQHESAIDLCNEAVERCEEFANLFQCAPVWESLAYSYGVRAKFFSPSPLSVEDYKKEASIWHQLHVLTYEPFYEEAQKAALTAAKADEKTFAPPTPWQKLTEKLRGSAKVLKKKKEDQ